MKRRLSVPTLPILAVIIVGAIIVALLIGNVVSFLSTRDRLPQNTFVGDVEVSGMNLDDAISHTVTSLQAPVALRYQTVIIQLQPDDIEYQVNDVVARLQLQKVMDGQRGLDRLPDYVLRRSKETHITTPYQYSETKLDEILNRIAGEHDQQAQASAPQTSTLTLTGAQSGASLNLTDARQLVLNALSSANSRFVDLPVDVVPGGNSSLQTLGDLIKNRVAKYSSNGSVAGVFVKDLKTGQEYSLNGDVAFSAQGWVKLAIVLEAYRTLSDTMTSQTAQQLTSMITEGSTTTTNEVLRQIGSGDPQAGANQLNATLKRMGLVSTFLAQPFDQPAPPSQFITPGNTRTDVNTSPDPNAQSTPAEVSVMFEMLETCRSNSGAIPLIFAGQFTSSRCDQVLNAMGQNSTNMLIAAGSSGATVIHRQSWDANNQGDAALVRSPGGTYVIAVMLHGNGLSWADSSQVIGDIARATYGYFNQGQVPPAATAMTAAPPP